MHASTSEGLAVYESRKSRFSVPDGPTHELQQVQLPPTPANSCASDLKPFDDQPKLSKGEGPHQLENAPQMMNSGFRNSLQASMNSLLSLFSTRRRNSLLPKHEPSSSGGSESQESSSISEFVNEVSEKPIVQTEYKDLFKKPHATENSLKAATSPALCEELLILADEQQALLENQRHRLATLQMELNQYKIRDLQVDSKMPVSQTTLTTPENFNTARNSLDLESNSPIDEPDVCKITLKELAALPPNSPLLEPSIEFLHTNRGSSRKINRAGQIAKNEKENEEWEVCIIKRVSSSYLTQTLINAELGRASFREKTRSSVPELVKPKQEEFINASEAQPLNTPVENEKKASSKRQRRLVPACLKDQSKEY